jgi:hypothetical protein
MIKETPEQKQQREAIEKIAKNIAALARSVEALIKGPLNRKALVTLLAASSGENKSTVDRVLVALQTLEKDWLK